MLSKTADPAVIRAAATLLRQDPAISNLRMLQRLAVLLGPEVTRQIPITRVERMVRDPALLLLRDGAANGEPRPGATRDAPARDAPARGVPEGKAEKPAPTPPSPPSPTPGVAEARGRARGRRGVPAAELDAALVEAFTLGVSTDSSADVVEAFRRLDALRRRLRRG